MGSDAWSWAVERARRALVKSEQPLGDCQPRSADCFPTVRHKPPEGAIVEGDAVMLETRQLARRPFVLLNARLMLPPTWIVHLLDHESTLARTRDELRSFAALRPAVDGDMVRVLPLEGAPDIANMTGKAAQRWVDLYLPSPRFWERFSSPWLLMFQMDSAFCPHPDRALPDFTSARLRHVFWGAPWGHGWGVGRAAKLKGHGGNSGLSLWHRPTMANLSSELERRAISTARSRGAWAMDTDTSAFLYRKQEAGLLLHRHVAKWQDAEMFSVETIFSGNFTPCECWARFEQLAFGR